MTISTPAPTEEKDENTKNVFYVYLEKAIDAVSRQNMLLLIGDFNAKIGKELIFKPTIGKRS